MGRPGRGRSLTDVRLRILMLRQDDPAKCTAARLSRLGLAAPVKRVPRASLVLDPFAERLLAPADARRFRTLTAVDCSWRLAGGVFGRFPGAARRLPPLLAGNPLNYSRQGVLSTAEALAGALYILGDPGAARSLLGRFRWGHTFYDLNSGLLEEYCRARPDQMPGIAASYGLNTLDGPGRAMGGGRA